MNKFKVKLIVAVVIVATAFTASAQKTEKNWTEWSKKEAQKILDDSAWAQTQTDTDTSQMFYSPTQDPQRMGTSSNDSSRLAQGATNQSINIIFHVRFFSARPVRQALARIMEIQQKPAPEIAEKLHNFANLEATDSIIVTVSFESNDQRASGPVMQAFNSAVTATLKNTSYLERSDGKRLFLEEYVPPGKDGFGARFIFLRYVNDNPFITSQTGEVRFHAEYPRGLKIDRRFKLADMMYHGQLEY